MTANDRTDELVAYLSRLTGETLTADQPVQLRSVERAALASWSRNQGLPVRFDAASSDGSSTIRELLYGAGASASPPAAGTAPARQPAAAPMGAHGLAGVGGLAGIGIDIEETAALPLADDYREHAFYRDNFTVGEIAHCIRQADARAAFCGTWAAKEAVLKSGLATAPTGRLDVIEIVRDAQGRPVIPGGHLSISHTSTTAVAVCIAVRETVPAAAAPVTSSELHRRVAEDIEATPAPARRPLRVLAAACVATFIVGAVSIAVRFWF